MLLNILHVIYTLSPRYGGPVSVVKDISNAQAFFGHNVTVVSTNSNYPFGKLNLQDIKGFDFNKVTIHLFSPEFHNYGFSFGLAKFLLKNLMKFDLVHVWGLYRFPQSFACLIARLYNKPYMVRPCGALEPFLRSQSAICLPMKRIHEILFDWPNLSNSSAINCVTAQEANNLPAFLSSKKSFISGNGIDWDSYGILPAKGSFRCRVGIHADTPLVLFLGRINFKKGLDLLIPAFSQVLEAVPRARLAIVGPDNEGYGQKVRSWCREQGIEDKVSFVDHLGPDEVKQAYVDADVFVLPSYTENFGMTVVEAMASACPVVISDQVNIWREVQADGAGLVTGLEPSQIADAICHVLSDKEEAKAMSLRGREAAKERYNWPRIVDQLTQAYERAIEDNAAKRQKGRT